MAWPPTIPANTRANTTPQVNTHPADHNAIADALTEIVSRAAGARYYLGTTQNVATGATLVVPWTELEEEGTLGFSVVSSTRITVPVAGFYTIVGCHRWGASGGTLYRQLQIRKNSAGSSSGGTRLGVSTGFGIAAGASFVPIALGAKLAAGDYVEAFATHGEAGTVTLDPTDTHLSLVLR